MHCLEVIIAKNAKAAGREAAHADNDDKDQLATEIHNADSKPAAADWFITGYLDGRKDG